MCTAKRLSEPQRVWQRRGGIRWRSLSIALMLVVGAVLYAVGSTGSAARTLFITGTFLCAMTLTVEAVTPRRSHSAVH